MAFLWSSKEQRCCDSNNRVIASVSTPLILCRESSAQWLFTRRTRHGGVEVYRGSENSWHYQQSLPIKTADSPGGAFSGDGESLLLVHRGFWSHHFLWSLWSGGFWSGNQIISVDGSEPESGGRGPVVIFFCNCFWIFYSDSKGRLCSFQCSVENFMTWSTLRMYSPVYIADGKPCVFVAEAMIQVCYNIGGAVCVIGISESGTVRSHRHIKTDEILGTPTLTPTIAGVQHLFYRTRCNRLGWWMYQAGKWARAAFEDITTHHAICYYIIGTSIHVFCCIEPGLLQGLHLSGVQNELHFNLLTFVQPVTGSSSSEVQSQDHLEAQAHCAQVLKKTPCPTLLLKGC